MALLSKLSNKRSQGSLYEQKARAYLETQGLKFIAANQTFKCGELDLVMADGDTVVFVEVRQRKSNRFGSAVESIDYRKQQKWFNAANMWLFTKRKQSLDTAKCRFDVVAFEGDNPPLWLPNFLG
ncbi:MAG: YraN family protein [Haemophilus paraphrohaemolyticus]|jgi:TIGR00252 family protein|uniref:YraN family protein n=1 Tax=Haemophilus paraphrohaemolyticus TaxID=736 RepID=UPI001ED2E96A|nr:YraN family protein [Haemophilus paraphrohaemolyticus]MBS6672674.1 YraN family protein [Haemophilus paraphrohaemolyticus]